MRQQLVMVAYFAQREEMTPKEVQQRLDLYKTLGPVIEARIKYEPKDAGGLQKLVDKTGGQFKLSVSQIASIMNDMDAGLTVQLKKLEEYVTEADEAQSITVKEVEVEAQPTDNEEGWL